MHKEKGITLIILVVTIIVLMIIAGISINLGIEGIKKAELVNLKTNMMLIQAKGKEYIENTISSLGTAERTEEEKAQIKSENLKGIAISKEEISNKVKLEENDEPYQLNTKIMQEMGLNELQETADKYIIIYNLTEEKVDIMYKEGINYDNVEYYTLSSIENTGL